MPKLYSATKQQADRLVGRIIRNGGKINSKAVSIDSPARSNRHTKEQQISKRILDESTCIPKLSQLILQAQNQTSTDKDSDRYVASISTSEGSLGIKKAFYKIKVLQHIEFLQVNHEMHKISKAIVEEARRTNAVIVVGKLKGIRSRIRGSRRVRRLINNFPYFRLVK